MAKKRNGCLTIFIETTLLSFMAVMCMVAVQEKEYIGLAVSLVFALVLLILLIAAIRSHINERKFSADYFEIKIDEESFKELKNIISSINKFHVLLQTNGFYDWLKAQEEFKRTGKLTKQQEQLREGLMRRWKEGRFD